MQPAERREAATHRWNLLTGAGSLGTRQCPFVAAGCTARALSAVAASRHRVANAEITADAPVSHPATGATQSKGFFRWYWCPQLPVLGPTTTGAPISVPLAARTTALHAPGFTAMQRRQTVRTISPRDREVQPKHWPRAWQTQQNNPAARRRAYPEGKRTAVAQKHGRFQQRRQVPLLRHWSRSGAGAVPPGAGGRLRKRVVVRCAGDAVVRLAASGRAGAIDLPFPARRFTSQRD